ncbi:DUF3037 domain-containing protein [Xylophilus rhododendri]|uniref:DUF3037 domain-containing protein n=1 Tax=Xylophilus rhododendri TaxID=2697032 RepID=A0A857J9Z9_9BURK|nr:DUF3037 domain-containing protein [Xylophilus rhododendri]QHJ00558.1 DUF3037 domain-containing protein [Xylophilus rhododendri]
MNRLPCQYALLRFRPFVETGEFANVGVVLIAPQARYFGFRLLKRVGRITHFFHQLDRRIYLDAREMMEKELRRFKDELDRTAFVTQAAPAPLADLLFSELTRTRDAMLQFDEPRMLLAHDPAEKLDDLFDCYVERNFAGREYQERLLETAMRKLLVRAELGPLYRPGKLGTADFTVNFPFVRTVRGEVDRVIKPLYLGQDEPTKLLTHGGQWVDRIRRLRKRGALPEKVLFTVFAPAAHTPPYLAFEEIRDDLRNAAVAVVADGDDTAILDFATQA